MFSINSQDCSSDHFFFWNPLIYVCIEIDLSSIWNFFVNKTKLWNFTARIFSSMSSSPMTKLIFKDFRLPENRIFEIEDSAFLMRIPFVLFSPKKMPKDSGSVHHYHHDDEHNDFSRIESFVLKFQLWQIVGSYKKFSQKKMTKLFLTKMKMTTARSVFELFKMKFLIDEEEAKKWERGFCFCWWRIFCFSCS